MDTKQGDKITVNTGRMVIRRDGFYEVFRLTPYEMEALAVSLKTDAKVMRNAANVAAMQKPVSTSGD
jgi:hypothetical protein